MSVRESDCLRALRRSAVPLVVAITVARRRPWASALFVGVRLTVAVGAADAAALDGWLDGLEEAELAVPDALVASVTVIERGPGRALIEMLVVED